MSPRRRRALRALWVGRGHVERERDYSCAPRHVGLAQLPVHRLGGSPGNLHLFGYLGPHFGLESLVQPRKLVFALLVPLAASLEIVLVVEATADRTPARETLGNVVPLHPAAPELNDQSILLGRPFALLLCWRLSRVWRHAAPAASAPWTRCRLCP